MAILLDEPESDGDLLISAATVAGAPIVAAWRNLGEQMKRLIDGLGFEVVTMTPASARRSANAYGRWGKGRDPGSFSSSTSAAPFRGDGTALS